MVCTAGGCSTLDFYSQAIRGHSHIMLQRQPIEQLLEDPAAPPALAEKLRLVASLCAFAETELHLPAGAHYKHYADIGRPYVVWDVYAAPEFSLEAKSWWYPFVGSLSYRGYFDEAKARRYARSLEKAKEETFVGGVEAYSTLGWFKDPVLNTFLNRDETELADLIFHELAHQKVFIGGETDFNEAFATAVAREGVRRWLHQYGDRDALEEWEHRTQREDQFIQLILATRSLLEAAYQEMPVRQRDPVRRSILRARKTALLGKLEHDYEILKRSWGGHAEYDAWFQYPINNARLSAEATYYQWVPAFESLLRGTGQDLRPFYREVRSLGHMQPKARLAVLQSLLPSLTQQAASVSRSNPERPVSTPTNGGTRQSRVSE